MKNEPSGPKLHASQFCAAFQKWAQLCSTPQADDDEHMQGFRKEFAKAWGTISLAISKSCLLDRLIYCGDQVRTEKCPVHHGHWSGITHPPCPHCGVGPCGCNTGWLPVKFEADKVAPASLLEIVASEGAPKPPDSPTGCTAS